MLEGIDISHWQGDINWPVVDKDFAIIKCSGGDGGLYTDAKFSRNNTEVMKKGIPHGFYHYIGGTAGAENEARYFASVLGDLSEGEFLMLDFEENFPSPVEYVRVMALFLMNRYNLKPMIYMNSSTAARYDWTPLVNLDCALVIANYGMNDGLKHGNPGTGTWPGWAIWQYTSVGKVTGINGNVDLDTFNGTKEQLLQYGYHAQSIPPEPQPPNGGIDVTQAQADEQSLKAGYIQEAGEWPDENYVTNWRNSGLTPYTYNQQNIQKSAHAAVVEGAVEPYEAQVAQLTEELKTSTAENGELAAANDNLETVNQVLGKKNAQLQDDLASCQENKPDGAIVIIINWVKKLFRQSEGGV